MEKELENSLKNEVFNNSVIIEVTGVEEMKAELAEKTCLSSKEIDTLTDYMATEAKNYADYKYEDIRSQLDEGKTSEDIIYQGGTFAIEYGMEVSLDKDDVYNEELDDTEEKTLIYTSIKEDPFGASDEFDYDSSDDIMEILNKITCEIDSCIESEVKVEVERAFELEVLKRWNKLTTAEDGTYKDPTDIEWNHFLHYIDDLISALSNHCDTLQEWLDELGYYEGEMEIDSDNEDSIVDLSAVYNYAMSVYDKYNCGDFYNIEMNDVCANNESRDQEALNMIMDVLKQFSDRNLEDYEDSGNPDTVFIAESHVIYNNNHLFFFDGKQDSSFESTYKDEKFFRLYDVLDTDALWDKFISLIGSECTIDITIKGMRDDTECIF